MINIHTQPYSLHHVHADDYLTVKFQICVLYHWQVMKQHASTKGSNSGSCVCLPPCPVFIISTLFCDNPWSRICGIIFNSSSFWLRISPLWHHTVQFHSSLFWFIPSSPLRLSGYFWLVPSLLIRSSTTEALIFPSFYHSFYWLNINL